MLGHLSEVNIKLSKTTARLAMQINRNSSQGFKSKALFSSWNEIQIKNWKEH